MACRNEFEQQLVDALRSGKYTQAYRALHRQDGFCCLGVACDLNDPTQWKEKARTYNDTTDAFLYDDSLYPDFGVLPPSVREKLGWLTVDGLLSISNRDGDIMTLAALNDSGFSFSEISDIIEAGLVS